MSALYQLLDLTRLRNVSSLQNDFENSAVGRNETPLRHDERELTSHSHTKKVTTVAVKHMSSFSLPGWAKKNRKKKDAISPCTGEAARTPPQYVQALPSSRCSPIACSPCRCLPAIPTETQTYRSTDRPPDRPTDRFSRFRSMFAPCLDERTTGSKASRMKKRQKTGEKHSGDANFFTKIASIRPLDKMQEAHPLNTRVVYV